MWHFFSWSVLRLTRPEKLASRGCHVRLIHSCQQKNTANTSWQHTEITAYNVNTRQPGAFLRLQTTYPLRGSSEASGVQRPGSPTQVLSGNFNRLDFFSGLSRHVQTAVDWHLLVSPYFILLHLLPQDPFKNLYDSLVNATSWLQQICSIGPHPTLFIYLFIFLRRCLISQSNWQRLCGWAEALKGTFTFTLLTSWNEEGAWVHTDIRCINHTTNYYFLICKC